ncbi:DUF202 domain-containing protein [Nocardia sp. NPDC050710]|uniref:DUF202 domain-containing protein n=1 Tax=Nocardia sp. NPDC050710 TaxID=3157220 RepID=UPI0033DE86F9
MSEDGTGRREGGRASSDGDVGLAAERTALSWRRTAISAMVVAVLFLNHVASGGWHEAEIAPIGAAATMATLAALCFARNRSLHQRRHGAGQAAVAATTVAVAAVACVSVAIVFTDP